ncbi:uncharacterized protein isoform X1 [Musca autumnalis]|uniref:uncharacterized protein isoform X1 n=1 Tax=Musca autumnalis TaxID=221902 RepID=UPI003CE9839C
MIAISERYQLDMENIASGSSAWHGIPLKDVGSESSFVIHAPVANLSTSRHPKSLLFLRRHQRYIIGYLAVYGDDEAPGSLEDFLLLAVTLVLCKDIWLAERDSIFSLENKRPGSHKTLPPRMSSI